jgi:hypothetical protein
MAAKQATKKKVRHIQLNVPADMYTTFHSNCVNEDTNMRAKLLELVESYNEKKSKKETASTFREFLETPKEKREAMLAEAAHKSIAETHALGLPSSQSDDKGIYRLYPDGHKEYRMLQTKKGWPKVTTSKCSLVFHINASVNSS